MKVSDEERKIATKKQKKKLTVREIDFHNWKISNNETKRYLD